MKNQWNVYNALKQTRDGGYGTEGIKDQARIDLIKSSLSIKDIREMDAGEVKEGLINYLETVAR